MATDVLIPELGENVEEGDVISILVAVGDTIAKDQPVVELETGKATIEVPSTHAGTVRDIRLSEGEKARVGQVILTLDAADEGEPSPAKETSPASAEAQQGATASTQTRVQAAPAPRSESPRPISAAAETAWPTERTPVAAAPSVRKFAREIGVDIQHVRGSGPGGRIHVDDVKAYAKHLLRTGGPALSPGAPSAPPLPDFSKWGEVDREKMSNVRKTTAEHMARSWATIPHVTQHDKADITRIERLRKEWSSRATGPGSKITATAVLLRVAASALKVFPSFNASIDIGNGEIVRKKYIHIGVAVDTPKGLVVPVIRDADTKNIRALAAELSELADRARGGKLPPDEMSGGTFTMTNLGGIGGSHFSPIINFPEVAILGVGRAETEPVWIDGGFEPRLRLPLSLSYDHRLIDGADAARFLRWIVEAVEEPLLLALEG